MAYQGYIATLEYSEDDEEFFGAVVNTSRDDIFFGGKTVQELKASMREAIDMHLVYCRELGVEPEKLYSGRLTYRTTPEQHARLMAAALRGGERSINAWMDEVLRKETDKALADLAAE